MRASHSIASLFIASQLLGAAQAQEKTVAEKTADVALEQARFNLQKAQLDTLASVRAQTGSSATIATGADTAEAMLLRHASYRGAVGKLVRAIGSPSPPLLVFGSTPPTVSQWLAFNDAVEALGKAATEAHGKWEQRHGAGSGGGGPAEFFAVAPVLIAAVTTTVSLLRVESTVTGAAAKPDDATLATLLAVAFTQAGDGKQPTLTPNYDEFRIGSGGTADANELLKDARLGAYAEVQKDAAAYAAVKFPASAKGPSGQIDPAKLSAEDASVYAAGESVNSVVASYNALKAGLLGSTNGSPNSTLIVHQKKLAEPAVKPSVLYIVGSEGSLTTITKKGAFVGLHSTPATIKMLTRITYVFAPASGSVTRGSVSCQIGRKFDAIKPALSPDIATTSGGASVVEGWVNTCE